MNETAVKIIKNKEDYIIDKKIELLPSLDFPIKKYDWSRVAAEKIEIFVVYN